MFLNVFLECVTLLFPFVCDHLGDPGDVEQVPVFLLPSTPDPSHEKGQGTTVKRYYCSFRDGRTGVTTRGTYCHFCHCYKVVSVVCFKNSSVLSSLGSYLPCRLGTQDPVSHDPTQHNETIWRYPYPKNAALFPRGGRWTWCDETLEHRLRLFLDEIALTSLTRSQSCPTGFSPVFH